MVSVLDKRPWRCISPINKWRLAAREASLAPSAAWSGPGAIKDRVTIESIFRYIFIYFAIILGISYGMGNIYQLRFIYNNRPKIITSSYMGLVILCLRAWDLAWMRESHAECIKSWQVCASTSADYFSVVSSPSGVWGKALDNEFGAYKASQNTCNWRKIRYFLKHGPYYQHFANTQRWARKVLGVGLGRGVPVYPENYSIWTASFIKFHVTNDYTTGNECHHYQISSLVGLLTDLKLGSEIIDVSAELQMRTLVKMSFETVKTNWLSPHIQAENSNSSMDQSHDSCMAVSM